MKDKVFLDTNIFVYAVNSSQQWSRQQTIARSIIRQQNENESGVISLQVVQEFYQVATTKIAVPLSTEDALEFIRYMSCLEVVAASLDMVIAAVHLHQRHRLSFWDALILQAAQSAGCTQVLSEDLQHNLRLDNLVVLNPFAE